MKELRKPSERLDGLVAYDPVEIEAEVSLSANENPQGMPHEVLSRLSKEFPDFRFNRYPNALADKLRERIAESNGLEVDNILIGNGGDELLFNFFMAWGGSGRKFLNMPPTFSVYEIDARLTKTEVINIPRTDSFDIDEEAVLERASRGDIDMMIVASPNNPTGNLANEVFLMKLLEATDAIVMVDEAYFEFSRQSMRSHMMNHKNLVILRTFSKAFSLAGLRVGYIFAHEDVVKEFIKVRQPYSVNGVSQWVASNVYRDRALFEQSIQNIIHGREQLIQGLTALPEVQVFDSQANFVLFRVDGAHAVWETLLNDFSVLIRDVSSVPYLENCLRVTVGTLEQNKAFLEAMREILKRRSNA